MRFIKFILLLYAITLASCYNQPELDIINRVDPIIMLQDEILAFRRVTNTWPKNASELEKTVSFFRKLGSDIHILSVNEHEAGNTIYKIKIEKFLYKNITYPEQIITINARDDIDLKEFLRKPRVDMNQQDD